MLYHRVEKNLHWYRAWYVHTLLEDTGECSRLTVRLFLSLSNLTLCRAVMFSGLSNLSSYLALSTAGHSEVTPGLLHGTIFAREAIIQFPRRLTDA